MKDLKNQKHYLINFKGEMINTKEMIDAILIHLDLNGKEGMNIGNVLKYAIRYKHKNGIEDLKKARNFLDYEIGDSPQETIQALESELNKILNRNIELEMENERLKNKVHNLHLDLENKTKPQKEIIKIYKNLKDVKTEDLAEELATRKGVMVFVESKANAKDTLEFERIASDIAKQISISIDSDYKKIFGE